MDGISRAIGAPWACKWLGKTYLAEPLRLWAIGAAENYILFNRHTVLDKVSEAVALLAEAPHLVKDMYERAYRDMKKNRESRIATAEQVQDWLNSPQGVAFSAWVMLRRSGCPRAACLEDVEEDVTKRMGEKEIASFIRGRAIASGLDAMANMDWRSKEDLDRMRPVHRRGQPEKGSKYIPWRRMFRFFATEYHWGPEQVGYLTMYQVKLYNAEENELGGTAQMSEAEAMAYKSQMIAMHGG